VTFQISLAGAARTHLDSQSLIDRAESADRIPEKSVLSVFGAVVCEIALNCAGITNGNVATQAAASVTSAPSDEREAQ
jgi:hypothetical protein